jgi:hypothetical protein
MSESNENKSILDLDYYKDNKEIAAILDIEALRYTETEQEIYFRKIENILKKIDSYLRFTITRDEFQKSSDGSINGYTRYYLDIEYQIRIVTPEDTEFNIYYKIVPKRRMENGASTYYNNSQIITESPPTIIDFNISWGYVNDNIFKEKILIREIFRQLYLNASLPIRELLSNYKAKLQTN